MIGAHRIRTIWIGCLLICLGACASTPPAQITEPPVYARDRMMLDDVEAPLEIYDPWEGFNRAMYRLNANLDHYVLLPSVAVYNTVIPGFARKGVTNFFQNLDEIPTLLNQLLQLKLRPAVDTTGRLLTNSTIGLVGLLDVATPLGITRHDEDFGQTLGHYNVGNGPYLVLPLFGPSSLRDGIGRAVDSAVLTSLDPLELDRYAKRQYAYYPLLILDTRANTAFAYYETASPFEYELVRLMFQTMRQLDVAK